MGKGEEVTPTILAVCHWLKHLRPRGRGRERPSRLFDCSFCERLGEIDSGGFRVQ